MIGTRTLSGKRVQYLVKWQGLGYSEATWENEDALRGPVDAVSGAPPPPRVAARRRVGLRACAKGHGGGATVLYWCWLHLYWAGAQG